MYLAFLRYIPPVFPYHYLQDFTEQVKYILLPEGPAYL